MSAIEHIPFKCISPVLLSNDNHPEYPFFSGTGFFVHFPPFEDIFFVTAKHCIYENEQLLGNLQISYEQNGNEVIDFEFCLMTAYEDDKDFLEDLVVFVVNNNIDATKKNGLKARALRLRHQDDVEFIIESIIARNENVRTVGFPMRSKEIDYEMKQAVAQPRGFYGKLTGIGKQKYRYKIEFLNWKEQDIDGFSGSPILSLHPVYGTAKVLAIPIGVLLTGAAHLTHFISINIVTNLIAMYLSGAYTDSELNKA